jgi:uncharacterized membrane protein
MTTTIEKSIEVEVPVRQAYDQWTQFEDFPQFMQHVERVDQLDDATTHWQVKSAGIEREFDAEITEQKPDERIAWRAKGETQHAGVVTFHRLDDEHTRVMLQMEVEPTDWVEKAADAVNSYERTVEDDLEHFKEFIESRVTPTGAWRGEIDQGATS